MHKMRPNVYFQGLSEKLILYSMTKMNNICLADDAFCLFFVQHVTCTLKLFHNFWWLWNKLCMSGYSCSIKAMQFIACAKVHALNEVKCVLYRVVRKLILWSMTKVNNICFADGAFFFFFVKLFHFTAVGLEVKWLFWIYDTKIMNHFVTLVYVSAANYLPMLNR